MASTQGSLRVLITGGGTGGHVIPALAIGRELRDNHAAEIRYVGTARGMETRLVPEAGFPLELIHVGQLKNVSFTTRVKTLGDLPRGIIRCLSLLSEFKPSVVIGVGGYASGPGMAAALLRRIPTLAYEPNAVPGLANRLVGRYVSAAAVNFTETTGYFHNAKVTGIPVRSEFFKIAPKSGNSPRHLLILGGSQGAQALNLAMPPIAKELLQRLPDLTIMHQAGERHADTTRKAYADAGVDPERVHVTAFLNAVQAMEEADMLLCRSGSTVAEICAAGRPALLVPFPQAADDHQTRNAEAMVRVGAAELLPQQELTSENLLSALLRLLSSPDRLKEMAKNAREASHPEALSEIAALAISLGRGESA